MRMLLIRTRGGGPPDHQRQAGHPAGTARADLPFIDHPRNPSAG